MLVNNKSHGPAGLFQFSYFYRIPKKMNWDVVHAEFGGDETANFGPRKESGTALYQIDTLATVSSRDQVLYTYFVRNTDYLCLYTCSNTIV